MPVDAGHRLPQRDLLHMRVALAGVRTERAPEPRYVVFFRVNLCNKSNLSVRVMGRKWLLQDYAADTRIIEATRVFNDEPILSPGAVFSFSGCQYFRKPPVKMELRLFGKDQTGYPFISPALRVPLAPPAPEPL